jgi:hypothetical protein
MEKETKISNPFDLYDIFGYIIPGLIFIFFATIILQSFAEELPIKSELLNKLHANFTLDYLKILKDSMPWWLETTILIALIAFVYIAGHIIASISSLLIDKYLIKKMSGYPSEKLFGITHRALYNRGFYKLLFMLINLYLLRLMFFCKPNLYFEIIPVTIFFLSIIGIKIKQSDIRINQEKEDPKFDKIGKIMSYPFNIVVHFIERMFGLNEKFNQEFIDEFKYRFEKKYSITVEKSGTNLYWFSYCYVVDKNEHMRDVIRHFLRMYGFTRNLSTSFFLLFLLALSIKVSGTVHIHRLSIFAYSFLIISILLMIRYYYLYFNYYSKFIFRAFYHLIIKDNGNPSVQD